ncbi:MAG: hypothetical protein ACRYFS_16815 [Janthinobacterium lividum]
MWQIRVMFASLLTFLPMIVLANPAPQVTMTASLDQSTYQIGQPIVLEADLHNAGTQEAVIGMTADRQSQFQITIIEASGRIVPRTALGDLLFTPMWAAAANTQVKIKPGRTRRCRFNLTDLYGLLRAGHYRITVNRTLGSSWFRAHESTLTAGPLKFQILKTVISTHDPMSFFISDPHADENLP